MRINLILAWLLLFAVNVFAQGRSVTGTVYSAEDNEPLIGATVKVKGENIAGATDLNGRFTLNGVSTSAKHLEVSYVGYQPKTVEIKPDLTIYLNTSTEMLDEMIVVAFGKQKREAFTGSATVVSSAEIEKLQVSNPVAALDGRVAGMQMLSTNNPASESGASDIVIRGIGSLNASTSPLIILDGLPYNGYLNDINPADIESITVLKDAASNALYGARGANGVIMITTKNANRGYTKTTVSAKWGANNDARVHYDYIDNPGEYYEAHYRALMNAYQYKQGMSFQQSHIMANQTLPLTSQYNGLGYMVYSVPQGQFLIGENGKLNPNAVMGNRVAYQDQIYTLIADNWTKEGTRTGLRQEYNVNISGGSDKYTIMTSLGYLGNEGIAYGSNMNRFTARLKTTYTPYSFMKIGANASYTHTETDSHSGVFGTLYEVAPIYPLYIRDGDGNIMTDTHGRRYDYGYMNVGLIRPVEKEGNSIQNDLLNKNHNDINAFSIQGFATIDFLNYFHLTINGSTYVTENRLNTAVNPYYGYNVNTGGSTEVDHYRTSSVNYQQLLNYARSFGMHSVDVLLGHEYTRDTSTKVGGVRSNIANFETNTELGGAIILKSNTSYKSMYNVEGYFLRGQYDYDNKYFANASFRIDGSSRFHPDHRWGKFWSLGAAWIITKEDWMPKSNLLNMLKFKASYGEQGNDGIGSFRYIDMYDISNSNDDIAFTFASKGNKDITWETVGNFNTGFEFELFNNRLSAGIEYYYRKTSDMLMWFTAPYEMGYSGYYDNVGDMVNQGIELDLNTTVIALKDFKWNIGLNLTWEKNRVTYLPEENAAMNINGHAGYMNGVNYIGEGLPVYSWYLKKYAGVGENGEALFYKEADDGTISTTKYLDEATFFLIGDTALPDVFGGFSTSFNLYGFDLSAQFNYSIGGKKMDYGYQSLMRAPYSSITGFGLHRDVFKSWTPENTDSNIPMWYFGDDSSAPTTDYFLINASYLTLKNINIGYNFPSSIIRKLKMSKLRLFASCENVAYWTKRKGFDPRVSFTQGSFGGYSPIRTISGGVQIEF
ncbi:MAG: SusC/RagA family TonB-linked outer membrane protein [Muribaculaceae bacterium]|nr:SusC/RagA family TonB-linked outer membrane protein [Muribaculaceae bacterium]MDE6786686.1 SusC/RagA family TonB-linked outer membrane protein [Muribaculaceae bacterium]